MDLLDERLKRQETELTDEILLAFLHDFKSATRKLVKQQITWFRNAKLYHWIDLSSTSIDPASQILKKWTKLALPGHEHSIHLSPKECDSGLNTEMAFLSKEEEKALKRYVPRLHYFQDIAHRREWIDHMNQWLGLRENASAVLP